jgi:hypothetical protein
MDSKSGGPDSSRHGNDGVTVEQALERILASKERERRRLAELPFEEKFRMVASMRKISDAATRGQAAVPYFALAVRTYAVVHKSILSLLPKQGELVSANVWMTIGVLLAFLLEAYLNHVGEQVVPVWSELERPLRPKAKLEVIAAELKVDLGSAPFATFDAIFRFRDLFAHGKTITTPVESPLNLTTQALDGLSFSAKPLDTMNRETVAPWVGSTEQMIRSIHAAYFPVAIARGWKEVDDPFKLAVHGPLCFGPLPSRTK